MMPVHPIGVQQRRGTLGDPYAVRNFEAIDPALGDAAALRALVDVVHSREMRILLDWTLSRSSIDNPLTIFHRDWYSRYAKGGIFCAAPNRDYFAGFDFSSQA